MAGFTNRQSLNQVSYKVYVPENVNPNTEVLVYCHGGGDYEAWYGSDYLKQNGSDTIVIFPTGDSGFRETNNYGAQVVDVINNVKQQYGITNNNLSVAGFSMGSTPTYTIMGEYLKQNPNCGSSTLYLLDNYPNANVSGINKFDSLLNDYGTYYKNNNTMFVAMIPQWDKSGTFIIGSKQKELDYLVQHGITNIGVLHSHKATFPGKYPDLNLTGDSHQGVEQSFWVDGFFNMSKNSSVTLDPNTYKLTIFNKNTGQYEITDFANLNSLDKLRQYFGINIIGTNTPVTNTNTSTVPETNLITGEDFLDAELTKLAGLKLYPTSNSVVKSDKDILIGNVNDVITDIKNTSFVSNGLDLSFSGSSTTQVPSGIPNIIGLYFTFATNMLTELSSFMDQVATAGESIYNLDTDLSKDANSLNDNATLNNNGSLLGVNNDKVNATVLDTKDEVTTVVRDNNSTTNSNPSYYSSPTYNSTPSYSSPNSYVSGTTSNNTVNNNDKVTAIPQDTWEEVTTVVRGENNNTGNVGSTVNNSDANNVVNKPNDVITSTPSVNDTNTNTNVTVENILPEVDVPKHDINNIVIDKNDYVDSELPDLDSIINDNNITNIPPVNSNTPVPKQDNSFNALGALGVTALVGGAVGVGTVVAKKAFTKEEVKEDDDLSKQDKKDLSQYKDDYFEEG